MCARVYVHINHLLDSLCIPKFVTMLAYVEMPHLCFSFKFRTFRTILVLNIELLPIITYYLAELTFHQRRKVLWCMCYKFEEMALLTVSH